jgi:hypothetical protein
VVFALVYWELDRRGPHARIAGEQVNADLLFPQNVAEPAALRVVGTGVRGLPVRQFTNSTAFRPTDTMPLSRRIKMAMLVQTLLSLVTFGLVGARAVNILQLTAPKGGVVETIMPRRAAVGPMVRRGSAGQNGHAASRLPG